jgi:hypothetical protein
LQLWERSALLVADAPVPTPKTIAALFAVLTPGERGDGAAIFAGLTQERDRLYLIDLIRGPLSPKLFHDVAAAVTARATAMHAQGSGIFTTAALAAHFERLGYLVFDPIDKLLAEGDQMLGVSAAAHVAAGRVRACSEIFAAAETAPLGFLSGVITEGDATQTSVLATIALSLDQNR